MQKLQFYLLNNTKKEFQIIPYLIENKLVHHKGSILSKYIKNYLVAVQNIQQLRKTHTLSQTKKSRNLSTYSGMTLTLRATNC